MSCCVGGVQVAIGYLNRPDLTMEQFIADPFSCESDARLYRTGDLCRWRSDGYIEFVRRVDHQVKVRGFRVELGEIESALKLHSAVRETVAVAREDVPGGRRLVAYVAPASAAAQVGELRGFLKERLPPYMLPSALVFIDAFPLRRMESSTARRCRRLRGARLSLTVSMLPLGPQQSNLASIWCEVLNLKQVGVHDDFFELGGHSLLATQVMSRVRNIFQVEIGVRALFEEPTIADLAKCIDVVLCEGDLSNRHTGRRYHAGAAIAFIFCARTLVVHRSI